MAKSPHDSFNPKSLSKKKGALLGSMACIGLAFIIQIIGAWISGSLALLGDTAHVFTDFFSLTISFVALVLAARPATPNFSFGFHRLEVIATFVNGLLLLLVAVGLIWEAVERFFNPQEVLALPLIGFAIIGLLLNLIAAFFLSNASVPHSHGHGGCAHDHGEHHHSHQAGGHGDRNIRSALMHVLSDALSSMVVIIGAIATFFTNSPYIDPALAVGLALVIARWSYRLLKDSLRVLLEACPEHLQPSLVALAIKGMDPKIKEVIDLHLWEISSGMYAATAELKMAVTGVEEAHRIQEVVSRNLKEQFGIAHAVFQARA